MTRRSVTGVITNPGSARSKPLSAPCSNCIPPCQHMRSDSSWAVGRASCPPNSEAYKVGKAAPYFRLQRLFFRQTFDLGGDVQQIEPDANQLDGTRAADKVILTLGKLAVTDIFDTNTYAHDPKKDFLNWAII